MAEWSGEDTQNLINDWSAGYSVAEIGRRIGRTKNSVVGRAHRLDLPRRPDPIGREGPKTQQSIYEHARRLRQHEATLARLPSMEPLTKVATHILDNPLHFSSFVRDAASKVVARQSFFSKWEAVIKGAPRGIPEPVPPDDAERLKAIKAVAAAAKPRIPAVPGYAQTRILPCCWPIGEPRTKQFRFCEADSVPGRPYCLDHCKIAYRVSDPQPPKEPTDGATRID